MKRRRLCFLLIILLTFFGMMILLTFFGRGEEHDFDFEYRNPYGDKFAIGPVTAEQAKQAIINWSGRQNLEITYGPVYYGEEPRVGRMAYYTIDPTGSFDDPPEYITWYKVGVKDPNPDHKYSGAVFVDSYTGAIKGICKGAFDSREGQISDMLPPQQAISRAREIVASYFPNVPIYSMELSYIHPELTEDGSSWKHYDSYLYMTFTNRVFTPDGEPVWINVQSVKVEIDSWTGELDELFCCYEPLEVSPIPSLTEEEMAQRVASYLYGLGASFVVITPIVVSIEIGGAKWWINREEPYGRQRLYTDVYLYIEGIPSLSDGGYWGKVDGHTGELFNAHQEFLLGPPYGLGPPHGRAAKKEKPPPLSITFNGMIRKMAFPPILKGGKVYISVEDVKKMGFRLERKGRSWSISLGDKSKAIKGKGLLSKDKRSYILGEALRKLKGVIVRYNKEWNQFHIVILNEEAFKRGQQDKLKLKSRRRVHLDILLRGALLLLSLGYLTWKCRKLLS